MWWQSFRAPVWRDPRSTSCSYWYLWRSWFWELRKSFPWCLAGNLTQEHLSRGALAPVTVVVVGSALCTEAIGIHALFGAFLAGTIMPDTNGFRHKLNVRLENFCRAASRSSFVLHRPAHPDRASQRCGRLAALPAHHRRGHGGQVGGKCSHGAIRRHALAGIPQLGALMNTRGLMELIALNIGYDMGILSARIFTMLVIMALVTTMLTGPLLGLFSRQESFSSTRSPLVPDVF